MVQADLRIRTAAATAAKPSVVTENAKLTEPQPFRRVATAIDGDPRESVGDIYAIGDAEFLVPIIEEHDFLSGELTSYTSRVDQAKKIISRPNRIRQISEMTFGEVSPSELDVLAKAVEAQHPPQPGYSTYMIRNQL